MIKQLRFLCTLLLIAVASAAWGETKSITFSELGLENGVQYTEPFTSGDVSVTFAGGGNDGKYYTTGLGIRTYGNGTITIAANGKTITKIALTFSGSDYAPASSDVWTSNGTGTGTFGVNASWSGSAKEVVLTRPSGSGHWRLQKVEVTFGNPTCATPIFTPGEGTYTSAQTVSISCTTDGATIYYTIDGSNPTASSSVYTTPISVSTTTIIKAIAVKSGMDDSEVATATYTIVKIEHAGTESDPYTVADARAAIDAGIGTTGVYATGIVSEIVTAYSSQHGNITFDIVDAEGNTQTIRAYRCTGDEAANVQVGDVVVVKGDLTLYGSTYEFGQGCQIVSRTSSSTQVAADLAFSANTASADLADLASFSAPTLLNPHSLAVTYASSKPEVATVDANGTVTIRAEGMTTITATSEETDEYLAGTASYTLTVTNSNKQLVIVDADGNITFDLSDNGWGFPTAKQVDEESYSSDGYTIKVAGSTGEGFYFYNDAKALLMGKNGAYLSLPAFDMPVQKIEVVGSSKAGTSVKQNIFVEGTAVSTETTGAKDVTNVYEIAEDYQAAGNVYTLKVTSAHNTQITSIKVYKAIADERENANIVFSVSEITITQGKGYTAPTFSNPNNVDVTFTTDNADVASWDNGLVLGTATGTAVITATFEGNESYKPATAMLTVTVKEDLNFVDVVEGCGIYQKITSASDLEAGKRYLIVYENGDKAVIYNGQNGTNSYAGKVDGDISENKIDNTTINATPIVLQNAGSGNWYLIDGVNFLYWNSGNTLEWTEKVAESDTWTIDVENGQIINAEETSRCLQYNTSSPRFACYAGTQKDVVLYKEIPETETITVKAGFPGTTYSSNRPLDFTNVEGLTAYIITDAKGTTQSVTKVPANTGLYLEVPSSAAEVREFKVPVTTVTSKDVEAVKGNLLIPTDGTQPVQSNNTTTYYAYGKQNDKYAFFKVSATNPYTPSANKALLAVPTEAGAKDFIDVNGGATSIEAIDHTQSTTGNNEVYNLAGQRVAKAQKGVYIVNGKKIVIR